MEKEGRLMRGEEGEGGQVDERGGGRRRVG